MGAPREVCVKNSKYLNPTDEAERNAIMEKRKQTLARKKAVKQSLAPIVVEFLNQKFPITEDGQTKKIDGAELIIRTARREIAKGGTTAIQMLKVLNDIMQGNPKIIAQFNFNNVEQPTTTAEREEKFKKLMGDKVEAEDVEVVDDKA